MYSIILPTYNRSVQIGPTLQSIVEQTYTDWELIVVDDGSVDSTQKTVEQFTEEDNRIRYVYQENAGASAARNRGVQESKGEWIVYVDSDDPVHDFFLETIDSYLEDSDALYGIGNHDRTIQLLSSSGKVVEQKETFRAHEGKVTLQGFYYWEFKTTSTGMFHKKNLLEDGCKWDEQLHYIEDWELLLQFGEKYPEKFLHIPVPLFEYKQQYGTKHGMCANAEYKDWAEAFDYIYKKHQDDPLMKGQQWWPQRVEKYTELQKDVEAGKEKPAMYKYFPDYEGSI